MKATRILAVVVALAGISLVARAAYLHAKAELAGVLIRHAWQQTIATGKPQPPWPWADTYPIARLRIPRLRYDEIVLEGATPRTLAFGPAHLQSGAALGEEGNVVIAGHRTSWFRPLAGIADGERIEIDWLDAQRRLHRDHYHVSAVRIADPADRSLLAPTAGPALTLITCYPFGPSPRSPQRFLVRAEPAAAHDVIAGAPIGSH